MGKFIGVLLLLVALGAAGGLVWWLTRPAAEQTELVLYGNVDLRQVQLAFNNSERIIKVEVEEGDRVKEGQILALLDTSRLKPSVEQAVAQEAAYHEIYKRLKSGSRPEEIAQAEYNVASARAELLNAQQQYSTREKLLAVPIGDKKVAQAVSKEDVDNARAALDVAKAKLNVNLEALKLAQKGPRDEEVAEAEKRWIDKKADQERMQQTLADAALKSPCNGIVRSRLMEPGEMATPQKAVFSLAIISPKWVRTYVSEADLGKIREKMKAYVTTDSFPNKKYEGYIKFISSVAEFTPKTVQTVELRTSLVFEVRIYVTDPNDELRLGMPATVRVPLDQPPLTAGQER